MAAAVAAGLLPGALAGCGSSGSSTAATTTSNPTANLPPTPTSAGGSTPERAGQKPLLNDRVCKRLGEFVRSISESAPSRAQLKVRSSGTSRLSTCSFSTPALTVGVSLDTAANSNRRFSNRIVEAVQFSNNDPTHRPVIVRGVGDPKADSRGAVWTSVNAQLLAIRGDRLIILNFYEKGVPDSRLRNDAAGLARRTYALTPSA